MKNKGFSLIELLISMAILGIVLAALTSLFVSQSRHHTAQNEILEMQGNARAAMEFVTRTLRDGTIEGLTITDAIVGGMDRDEISFHAVETINPRVICPHGFRIYNSTTDGPNTLGYIRRDHNPPTFSCPTSSAGAVNFAGAFIAPLARNITGFNIQRIGNRIDIRITAQTDNPLPTTGRVATITLESSVYLRN